MPAPIHVFAVRGKESSTRNYKPISKTKIYKYILLILTAVLLLVVLKLILDKELIDVIYCGVLLLFIIVFGLLALCDAALRQQTPEPDSRRSSVLINRQRQQLRNVVVQPTTPIRKNLQSRPSLASGSSEPPLYHHVVVLADEDDKRVIDFFDKEYENLLENMPNSPPPPYEDQISRSEQESKNDNV